MWWLERSTSPSGLWTGWPTNAPSSDMPARTCLTCGIRWPTAGKTLCPFCDTQLQYMAYATPDQDWPPEIPKELPELEAEVADEIVAGWAQLEGEFTRRRGTFSMADLIGEDRQPKAG